MQVDQSKISTIMEWPKPNTICGLRGFLGLTGCYKKFVQNYGTIAAPLTAMLLKNSFRWTDETVTTFERLTTVTTTTPILILLNFELTFIIKCDASNTGIVALLLQQNKLVAYFNQSMVIRHQSLLAYGK